jgi:hypothetical protein
MLSGDSCMGIMEWSSGYLVSRHGLVRPKHGSNALLVELLDEEGGCLLGLGLGLGLRGRGCLASRAARYRRLLLQLAGMVPGVQGWCLPCPWACLPEAARRLALQACPSGWAGTSRCCTAGRSS